MRWMFLLLWTGLVFPLSVDYSFKASNLILKISGSDPEYIVRIDGKTYKTTGVLVVPWEKGRVDVVLVEGAESGERESVMVKGIHDSPPRIFVDIPEVLGLREVKVHVEAYDDWDEEVKTECFLDGKPSGCRVLDPLPLEGREHTFEVRAKDSFGNTTMALRNFVFDRDPPPVPKMVFQSPGIVVFPDSPRLEFLMPDLGVVDDVSTLRLDKGYVLRAVDDAGNRGSVFVLPPIPSDLSPFSGMAVTSIAANTLLIGSKKFSIVGKVLIPEGKVLAVGEGISVIVGQNAELVVKGRLQGISGNFSIVGGGNLKVTEGGELYVRDSEIAVELSSNGGRVVYLDGVEIGSGILAVDTNYVVLKDMDVPRLECRNCDGIFLENVRVGEIIVDNTSLVDLEGVEASSVVLSGFIDATLRNSTITSLSIDTVTRVDVFESKFEKVGVDKGSRLRMRYCEAEYLRASWFSKVEYHGGSVEKKEVSESEVIER